MNDKDRGYKLVAIAALLLSVIGLSIAYAGYTSTLTVEGTATAESAWKIIWKDLDAGTATGYASVEDKTLAIDSTKKAISGFMGKLRAPGDTITYTWKVANEGKIDATLTGVTLGSLSCAPAATNGSTATEATNLCAKLSIAFTYDGSPLTASTTGDLLKDTSKNVTMTLTYASGDAVELSGDVAVTLSRTSFTYDQKAKS